MALGGVVDEVELQVLDAGLLHETLGLRVALGLRHLGVVDLGHLEARGGLVDEVVGRGLAALEDLVDDHVSVDRHRQRAPHAGVLQLLLGAGAQVHAVVVGAEVRHRRGLVGILLLQLGEAPGGQGLHHVELAGEVAGQRLVFVVDDVERRLLHGRVGGVPVGVGLLDPRVLVGDRLGEGVGPVGDDVLGVGPVVAELLDHVLARRVEGREGGHRGEVGRGIGERHLERVVVHRLDAELGRVLLAGQDLGRVLERGELHEPRVLGGRGGVGGALPGIDEVLRRHGLAVGPLRVVAQGEGELGVVLVGLEARGDAGHNLALGVLAHQTLEDLAGHVGARGLLDELRVDGRILVEEAVGEGLVLGQGLAGLGLGSLGEGGGREGQRGGAGQRGAAGEGEGHGASP